MTILLKTLLEISIVSGVMIIVVLGVRAIFAKRMNPLIITFLWAFVLLRLIIPFTIQSPVQIAQLVPELKSEQEVQEMAHVPDANTTYIEQGTEYIAEANIPDAALQVQDVQPEEASATPTFWQRVGAMVSRISIWSALAGIWLLGAAFVLFLALRKVIMFKRKLAHCRKINETQILDIVNGYKQTLGVKRKISLIECSKVSTPAVFGYFRPKILLPSAFINGMEQSSISCILLHEMCHIKRHDILKSYIWLVAKAVHWFNPLVWVAFKMARDDSELCCDQMVLKELRDNRFEYSQSLINVFRLAKQRTTFEVTVSLFENKAMLVERVIRMLKPQKKSKSAIAITVLMAAVMAVACFTTACYPVTNADEEIVAIEEEAAIEETIELEAAPTHTQENNEEIPVIEEEEQPLAMYSVTGHWADSVERDGSIIKLKIDTDIVMPDVDTVNTYYVNTTGRISQEMSDKILEVLFGDTPLYEYQELTKAYYQVEIDRISSSYQSMLDGTFDSSSDYNDEEMIRNTEENIARLKKLMKDAPETIEQIPMNTVLAFNDYGEAFIRGVADLGREEKAQIIIDNNRYGTGLGFSNGGGYFERQEEPYQVPIGNLSITAKGAIDMANQFIADIGLSDYQLYDNYIAQRNTRFTPETGQFAHVLRYTKVVDGIEVSQNPHIPLLDSMNCNGEQFVITIDDDGIREIDWSNGFKLEQTASQDQKLLPIEEIEDIIADKMFIHEPMIKRMNEDDVGVPGLEMQEYIYNIDQIRLEYMKIPYGDDLEDIRLIPVWSVFASEEWRYSKVENGERVEDVRNYDRSYVRLTINAIDGSMVDKELWANRKFY